jgi:hypothetical protein
MQSGLDPTNRAQMERVVPTPFYGLPVERASGEVRVGRPPIALKPEPLYRPITRRVSGPGF